MTKPKKFCLPARSKRQILLAFWLIVGLFAAFSLLVQQSVYYQRAVGEDPPPLLVKVSNLAGSGFTVTWLTKIATTGQVLLGESRQETENQPNDLLSFPDDRGLATVATTHFVTLYNLVPEKTYYFLIKSGKTIFYKTLNNKWAKTGVAEEKKTLEEIYFNPNLDVSPTNTEGAYSLEPGAWKGCGDGTDFGSLNPCFRPNLVWGKVTRNNGQVARGALVHLEIPGKSTLLSSFSDYEGKWTINLANLIRKDLGSYLPYSPGTDLIRLTAEAGNDEVASAYKAIPEVIAERCLNIVPQECLTSPPDQTNPVNLQLNSSIYISPTQSASKPTAKPTTTPTPINPQLTIKIKCQGVSQPGQVKTALLSLKKGEEEIVSQSLSLTANAQGVYETTISTVAEGNFTALLKPNFYPAKKALNLVIQKGSINFLDFSQSDFLAGDLNDDNRINLLDLGIMLANFRANNTNDNPADLNLDHQINSEDLGILIANYRQTGDSF